MIDTLYINCLKSHKLTANKLTGKADSIYKIEKIILFYKTIFVIAAQIVILLKKNLMLIREDFY